MRVEEDMKLDLVGSANHEQIFDFFHVKKRCRLSSSSGTVITVTVSFNWCAHRAPSEKRRIRRRRRRRRRRSVTASATVNTSAETRKRWQPINNHDEKKHTTEKGTLLNKLTT